MQCVFTLEPQGKAYALKKETNYKITQCLKNSIQNHDPTFEIAYKQAFHIKYEKFNNFL